MATFAITIDSAINLTSTTSRTTTGSTTTTVYTVPANTYLDCVIETLNTAVGSGGGAIIGRATLVIGGVTIHAATASDGDSTPISVNVTQTYKLGPGTTIQTVLSTDANSPSASASSAITVIGTLFDG